MSEEDKILGSSSDDNTGSQTNDRDDDTNLKIRKAEACKEQGNSAFKESDFDGAVAAYIEGASVAATVEGIYRSQVARDVRVACFCNAAQARIKQEAWSEAAALCSQALEVDPKSVKALYRRGLANLQQKAYSESQKDFKRALELEPKNSELRAKLAEAERTEMNDSKKAKGMNNYDRFANIQLSDDDEEAAAAAPQVPKVEPTPTLPGTPPKSSPAPPPKASPKAASPAPPKKVSATPATEGTELKPGTGYRYWAKGASAPRVIPQKIDPSTLAQAEVPKDASAWNAAGTYEEKDQTAWAKAHLAELFETCEAELEGGGSIRCKGVKDVNGDCGIHLVRGRKRYIFDLHFKVPFEVDLSDSDKVFTGAIQVTDFSSEDQSDWEADIKWDERPPASSPHYGPAMKAVGKSIASGVVPDTVCHMVAEGLKSFLETFKAR
eukprot:CAMPEP_0206043240 /NCGR_PEP_ID=MMETSP1466-20131121/8259_1 /ASSEMBLY_ACC=CAM_ASM_001126 /TAXON_ID=44452 /ORGANISM="Pavlova gyrans, Strain CCMP608" /LENGTH=437 /DNA_ID=CAMNT_0053418033 /DNA_START=15 /DNA_END=1328 /DNA_ORIENTATION=-